MGRYHYPLPETAAVQSVGDYSRELAPASSTATLSASASLAGCQVRSFPSTSTLLHPELAHHRAGHAPLVGHRVRISGLHARPNLNGKAGIAESFNGATGRYNILLDGVRHTTTKTSAIACAACSASRGPSG